MSIPTIAHQRAQDIEMRRLSTGYSRRLAEFAAALAACHPVQQDRAINFLGSAPQMKLLSSYGALKHPRKPADRSRLDADQSLWPRRDHLRLSATIRSDQTPSGHWRPGMDTGPDRPSWGCMGQCHQPATQPTERTSPDPPGRLNGKLPTTGIRCSTRLNHGAAMVRALGRLASVPL